MNTYHSALIAAFVLTGCFNTSISTTTNNAQINDYSRVSQSNTIEYKSVCKLYVPLPAAIPPDIPVDKIRKSINGDNIQTLIILAEHIKQLREYIVFRKKQEALHYDAYLKECSIALK
jgi:hypothetical protein